MPISGIGSAAEVDPVASLVSSLNAATSALSTRQVIAGTGLTGGGTLAADRTLAVDFSALNAVYAQAEVSTYAYGPWLTGPPYSTAKVQRVSDPSGYYGEGFIFGNVAAFGMGNTGTPAGQYAPIGIYQRYGDSLTGSATAVQHTTQAFFAVVNYYGPTQDDSAEGLSSIVLLKGTTPNQAPGGSVTVTPFTQTKPVTASEFDVFIEGGHQVSGTYSTCVGARTEVTGSTAHTDTSYGVYLYANTDQNNSGYGSVGTWRAFIDLKYNPATGAIANSESFHGANRVLSEQALLAKRANYGGLVQVDLAGSIGSESASGQTAQVRIQQPTPGNTTTIADGAFTSGSALMTTATAPTTGWIGRTVTNANVPAATQVKTYYGSSAPYTVVLTANATGTASSQTVTITEPDLVGLRIVQGTSGLQPPLEYWATSDTFPSFRISRVGAVFAKNSFQTTNSSGTAQAGVDTNGYRAYASAVETTGAGSAALGSNCPAVTATAPYKWFKATSSDGSTVYIPCWK